ncbi:non-hydrolyzing UDP-N-acetylglucosamine 2-epimerase [Methanofollis fontis]|uniref:UDP-N-acetylglucosamine 2-epimerase (Non-hydrolyzing) n=1 Tax=Methanofollis fontis TaxID=2052832 RepID=A0A483CNT3_9EURY|nr:UDP-N-acetylglucosamine 2-epimerase (non-hydrolyzing) [Methanofollis fontis]TAJ43687.1 UDP-N-acetylglucosamine 2-epimerase (non-hydrolyzing) [Methanofollis fontis]
MIAIVLGTRPEIIKMSPIIRACEARGVDYFILHTGQHYSYEMDRIFFEELRLPAARYRLDVGSGPHGEQTGKMLAGIEAVLLKESPDYVVALGDPNSALAGALAAAKLHIPVCHVEAGRRSYNRMMPEEINRVIIDQIADRLCTPTEVTRGNLLKEGIDERKIILTGDPIVSAVRENLAVAQETSVILEEMHLTPKGYLLVTAHRAENVDSKERLESILTALRALSAGLSLPVVFPLHPRTEKKIREFGLSLDGIQSTSPLGYFDFLYLEANARLVLTDSGCIQEEACILGVPCVTLRDDTERPETLAIGCNVLAGTDPDRIINASQRMLSLEAGWKNPFGDENSGTCIVKLLCTS